MNARSAAAFAVLLFAAPALAKPIYITVPRSYGTDEPAVVDVAFAGKEPVELRVLRPDSLEAFVKAQQNLRRAYEAPPTTLNPGRDLARGLNGVKSPGRWLLYSIDPELRRELSPELEKAQAPNDRPLSHLREGAERLVGIPPGMTLVRSEWLNLDLGGSERDFNVPGFDMWSGNSGFQERRVSLSALTPGVYVLQLVQGRIEGQVVLVVSDLKVQVKQTDGQVLVRVAGKDLRPVSGAQIQIRLSGNNKIETARTDERGEATLKVDDPKLLVLATSGPDTSLVDTDFYSSLAVAPDVFIYTDRPIYKPGDEARFRGVVRRPDGFLARLFTPAKREVEVKLVSQENREASTRVTVDEFGCFYGRLAVPKDLGTGVLRVVAKLDDKPHQSESRVQEYVKPTFYLELVAEGETVTPGEPVKAKLRARRYAGGAPKNTAYEVYLYRSLVDAPAWVDDSGMGGQGSAITYGTASTTEGKLSVPERLYSSVMKREERGENVGDDSWKTAARLDKNGEAELEIEVPALKPGEERLPYKYTLSVRARDDQGTFANGGASFYKADSEVVGAIRPSAKLVMKGQGNPSKLSPVSFTVRATSLSGRPYPGSEGSVSFALRKADGSESTVGSEQGFVTGEGGQVFVPVAATEVGTLVAKVTLKDKKGKPWHGEGTMLVADEAGSPVAKVPALSLESLGGVVAPGDTAQLVALFPDGWGREGKAKGPVWVTLSGNGIFGTRVVEASGQTLTHKFEIEKRFGSAVYASLAYPTKSGRWEERTVAFRIVPAERTLRVEIEPQRAEVLPLGEQVITVRVTDNRGHGVASEVSVGVVDKAIYAIQSEFRPRILDFFYPLGRNNVATFTSAEFQGYGYGEALARAFGKSGYAFAGIKPPSRDKKKEDQDTAFWHPAVVTDRDGRAQVTFRMPSNQTLWTVTAVAADAGGRFGESTAEFASRGSVQLYASVPQFLRAGDEAQGSIRVTNMKVTKADAKFDLAATTSGALATDATGGKKAIPAGGEWIVPVSLKASGEGSGQVSLSLAGGPEPMKDRRELAVRAAEIEDTAVASAWGGGGLEVPVPAGARVESLELRLSPTTVEAALTSIDDLLTYPYGCLEQLVATTIPNIAVYRTLEKVNAIEQLDPESRALLAEARSRSVQGVSRILALSVKGGGFTWFGGYSTPSPALTLIALDGLTYAADAGLVDRDDPRLTEAATYLEKIEGLPPILDATRTYVLARLQGERQAARVRSLLEKVTPGDLHVLALAVLAAEESKVAQEPALKDKVAQLVEESRDAEGRLAGYDLAREDYWSYPLRRVGLSALLFHAASFGKVDLPKARERLVSALASPDELSTFEKSTALLHSLWLIEKDAKEMRHLSAPEVSVPGGAKVALVARGAGLVAKLDPSVRRVSVAKFDGVATLKARVRTPYASAQPVDQGMFVERSYYALRGGQRIRIDGGASGPVVTQGEDVYVELKIDARGADRKASMRSAYYVLEDAVPAGFVPLVEDKIYRGAPLSLAIDTESLKRRSVSPERVSFFFEEPAWWSDHARVVGYVMRAQFPGRFGAPPATAADMYSPRVKGRSAPATLAISPSGAAGTK
jgi:uncharacterized protein YfaS (alpha-2-macroglobulin family)